MRERERERVLDKGDKKHFCTFGFNPIKIQIKATPQKYWEESIKIM